MARLALVVGSALAAAIATIAACTDTSGLSNGGDGGGTGVDGGGDAPADGGGTPPPPPTSGGDGGDGGDAGPTNLLTNGGFEIGSGACGVGWYGDRTTLNHSNVFHGGALSCEVCTVPPDPVVNVFPVALDLGSTNAGESFYAEAWIHASTTGMASTVAIQLEVDSDNIAYGQALAQTTWQPIEGVGTAPHAGKLHFAIRVDAPDASVTCFLIDDVVVIRQ